MADIESTGTVRDQVRAILDRRYPGASFAVLDAAFADLERLYTGGMPGYLACDTRYHDLGHTLQVTLAMARLIDGHDRVAPPERALGPRRALAGVLGALLHDAGYIRTTLDGASHGAQYTRIHVSRSAAYIARYLPAIGLAPLAPLVAAIVHFTGYEIALENIPLAAEPERLLGHLLGSADLIGQMADRAYLERCRDFLYEEFEVAGIARELYGSADELLRKTVGFYENVALRRLEDDFAGAHRFAGAHFGDGDPYAAAIGGHMAFLRTAVRDGALERLRRVPRSFTALPARRGR